MKQDQKKDDLCEKLLKYLDGNLEKQERLEIEKQLKSDRDCSRPIKFNR
jgi:anti-sigma factor RsiW